MAFVEAVLNRIFGLADAISRVFSDYESASDRDPLRARAFGSGRAPYRIPEK